MRKLFLVFFGVSSGLLVSAGVFAFIAAIGIVPRMAWRTKTNHFIRFYEENREMPAILSIPYSIGLGLGIIIFFNHFSKASLTEDPTPIEIEMTTYEKETNASIIDFLGRRKGGGEG